jgi:hypothetical protein
MMTGHGFVGLLIFRESINLKKHHFLVDRRSEHGAVL